MKITFLGTGTSAGVPLIGCTCSVCTSDNDKDKRLRSSVLIEINNQVLVLDTGPDFRQQMLRENVSNLSAVLFTHEHKDHVAGLDDIRAFNFILKKKIDVYVNNQVEIALKREFPYIFSGVKYPGIPQINLNRIKNKPFEINGLLIEPIEVMHYKLPVFGYRIGDFAYITDANYISEKEKNKLKGVKYLVLNALRKEEHISHFIYKFYIFF